MAWTVKQILIALMLVITGSINTLATKWADNSKAVGSDHGAKREFNHPFFQAVGMFLGETMCLVTFLILKYMWKTKRQEELRTINGSTSTSMDDVLVAGEPRGRFNPFVFLPPAMCDMIGTSLMYVGLNMTYPSSFQMLRGALIIFTGLLSVAFLGRTLRGFQWIGMFAVTVGLVVVGLSDFITSDKSNTDMNAIITGDLLIVMAQVVAAVQMVVEERFVTKMDVPPMLAVGCEGIFGFTILGILMVPMYYITVPSTFNKSPGHRLEDALDAFEQMGNNSEIIIATAGSILSIAFFNFAGISVTKDISATTRTVLDSVRTLVIWFVSLAIGWQSFHYLQLIGFVVLVVGMLIYNDIVFAPYLRSKGWLKEGGGDRRETEPVIDSNGKESPREGIENPLATSNSP